MMIRRIKNPYTHCGWIANPAEQEPNNTNSGRSFGRICNPTAVSISICNAIE